MRYMTTTIFIVLVITLPLNLYAQSGPIAKMEKVRFDKVTLADQFWQPRLKTNREVTLAHNLKLCEETGRIDNFAKAAGMMEGEYEGRFYNDSDVYKVLEGAAYILGTHPDPELETRIDKIIDKIAAAQQPDGYLNSYYTCVEPDQRWTDLKRMHELYCAGHMFEAAVAYHQATGKDKFLNVAKKFADHINHRFGPDKKLGYPGHEEIELALVKLFKETGEKRYLNLAKYFVDARSKEHDPKDKPQYFQIHKPVLEQKEVVGHAVRAMYLYAGTTDIANWFNHQGYLQTMETLWQDVACRKMAITGGVGARHHDEAFGNPYELPNDTCYNETCAGIGLALWNSRLLSLHADSRFANVIERVIYNHILGAVSLSGDKIFYVNPLTSDGTHLRQPWYTTACCPTNIIRFLPQVPSLVYSKNDTGLWVNLYAQSEAQIELKPTTLEINQTTRYPWDGKVFIALRPEKETTFDINLRIPGWCTKAGIKINGQPVNNAEKIKGYVCIRRKWQKGDRIELTMPMEIKHIQAHPHADALRGKIALQRGPIVYCVEAADNNGKAFDLSLPRNAELKVRYQPDLLGGVVTIEGDALKYKQRDWKNTLYQSAGQVEPTKIKAIPYNVWGNREPGQMTVWIPEQAAADK